MEIKKTTLYGFGVIIMLLFGGFFLAQGQSVTGNVIANTGEIQHVKLSVVGSKYVLEPSELRKGVPVRLEAQDLPGCSRAVRIPAFKVSKTFYQRDNIVEFTPDKTGEFNIACSMNMYVGRFTVLEDDGTKSEYVENNLEIQGGSCGQGSGGGCGCGG